MIGVEKGEMSTADNPRAPGQRELNEAQRHLRFPFFPASA